jgi:nicotinamide mononucleotide adenylyltransferase
MIEKKWLLDMNEHTEYLHVVVGSHKYPCTLLNPSTRMRENVTRELFRTCVASVKAECTRAALKLVKELNKRFPLSRLMESFAIIFPQFWSTKNSELQFLSSSR